MPNNPNPSNAPHSWLQRARSNFIRASQPKPDGVFWEDMCFDAQQAVEKSLKALLIYQRVRFRYVHDIAELLTLIEQNGITLPEEIKSAAGLTEFAVQTRYPGVAEPVTRDEYEETIRIAESVITWVGEQI